MSRQWRVVVGTYDSTPVVRADCGKGKRTAHNHNFNRRSPR